MRESHLWLCAVVSRVGGHGDISLNRAEPELVQADVGCADAIALQPIEADLRQWVERRTALETAALEATALETAALEP